MSTLIRYTLLRLLIFAVCFGVLWMLFDATLVSYWLLALLALLFTSGLSMLLLRRQGTQAGQQLRSLVTRGRGRFEGTVGASARKEDAELDEQDALGTVGSTGSAGTAGLPGSAEAATSAAPGQSEGQEKEDSASEPDEYRAAASRSAPGHDDP